MNALENMVQEIKKLVHIIDLKIKTMEISIIPCQNIIDELGEISSTLGHLALDLKEIVDRKDVENEAAVDRTFTLISTYRNYLNALSFDNSHRMKFIAHIENELDFTVQAYYHTRYYYHTR